MTENHAEKSDAARNPSPDTSGTKAVISVFAAKRARVESDVPSPEKGIRRLMQVGADNNESTYKLRNVIGTGAFGTIYLASCLSGWLMGREVAVKKIQKAKLNKIERERCYREGALLSRIKHPNIIAYYEQFDDASSLNYVLELCPHGNLSQYIDSKAEKRLPEPEVRHIMEKLIGALKHLHRVQVLHRDIKCSNVLIGSDFEIKLADFGLAASLSKDQYLHSNCGTYKYMSPEKILGEPYSFSSDVWSLGCVLVVLLTGTPPFNDAFELSLKEHILTASYKLPDYVSPYATRLVQSILVKDPQQRISLDLIKSKSFFHKSLPRRFLGCRSSSQHGLPIPPPLRTLHNRKPIPSQPIAEANHQMVCHSGIAQINTSNTLPFEMVSPRSTLMLLPSGILVLWLTQEPLITAFSSNGEIISLFCHSPEDPISEDLFTSTRRVGIYTFATLPEEYKARYLYASQQLDMARRGAFKVEYISDKAYCRLWPNKPLCDFHVRFDTGLEISSQVSKNRLIISHPHGTKDGCPTTIEFDTTATTCFNLPSGLHSAFIHFQACLKRSLVMLRWIRSSGKPNCNFFRLDASSFGEMFPEIPATDSWHDVRLDSWSINPTEAEKRHLPGVGWATLQPSVVSILFNDGCRLEVNPKTKEGEIVFPSQPPKTFHMLDDLPTPIHERLAHYKSLDL